MKTQRLMLALTGLNILILLMNLMQIRPAVAASTAQVLRGRALEIVDEEGRIRSQIIVTPPSTMPDGKEYPETALFRLIDPNGRPAVKIGASVDGSAMSLAGDSERSEWSGVQILAGSTGSTVKLTDKNKHEQIITP